MNREISNESIKNLKQGDYFYATPDGWGDTYYLLKNDDQKCRDLIMGLVEVGINASIDDLITVYVDNAISDDDHRLTYSNGDSDTCTCFLNLNWV
tara:strand:+ start:693 stop:977 length:285 start_codon:yes stop_codon:yes gene_type:complete